MTRLSKLALWGLTLLAPIALAACYGPHYRDRMPSPEPPPPEVEPVKPVEMKAEVAPEVAPKAEVPKEAVEP